MDLKKKQEGLDDLDISEFLQLIEIKRSFEAVGYCLAHGIMEYWNVGMSKIPLAGMIL
jgi:hypothetical protein